MILLSIQTLKFNSSEEAITYAESVNMDDVTFKQNTIPVNSRYITTLESDTELHFDIEKSVFFYIKIV
ncbi:hypothetical protein VP501E541_P0151 [Vibrio phage 501E54-1]|nr:hypothetical protein VP501E541_P0151 [Vibrio phage 501E54-1]